MHNVAQDSRAERRQATDSSGRKFLCIGTGVIKPVPFDQLRFGQIASTHDPVAMYITELEVVILCALIDPIRIRISKQCVALC